MFCWHLENNLFQKCKNCSVTICYLATPNQSRPSPGNQVELRPLPSWHSSIAAMAAGEGNCFIGCNTESSYLHRARRFISSRDICDVAKESCGLGGEFRRDSSEKYQQDLPGDTSPPGATRTEGSFCSSLICRCCKFIRICWVFLVFTMNIICQLA